MIDPDLCLPGIPMAAAFAATECRRAGHRVTVYRTYLIWIVKVHELGPGTGWAGDLYDRLVATGFNHRAWPVFAVNAFTLNGRTPRPIGATK